MSQSQQEFQIFMFMFESHSVQFYNQILFPFLPCTFHFFQILFTLGILHVFFNLN